MTQMMQIWKLPQFGHCNVWSYFRLEVGVWV